MSTTSERTGLPGTAPDTPKSASSLITIDEQLFRLCLSTIVSAHLYGHMSEADALRVLVRAMRERLLESAPAGTGHE